MMPAASCGGVRARGDSHDGHDAHSAPETAAAEANAALITGAYDAFGRGDVQNVFAVLAEDIFWHVPGRGPLSRDYRGHAEVRGFFEHFMSLSKGTFRIKSTRFSPSATGSSYCARKPRSAPAKAGLLRMSTFGS